MKQTYFLLVSMIALHGCGSGSATSQSADAAVGTDTVGSTDDTVTTDAATSGTDSVSSSDDTMTTDTGATPDTGGVPTGTCEEISATFVTLGSANADLPEPAVSATCVDGNVIVTANQIPDFPYIETSPGAPSENDLEFIIPSVPEVADSTTAIPALGALGVAVNGIPIFGPTEGAGGDVMSLGNGFNECGGHNGPSGYHYHLFDVYGSDDCRFSEAEAKAGSVLFGWAFDGYPIYSGNFQYTSSYALTDESLFASDTWAAHTYTAGSGDLDECNGRTDSNGNYAYYTTDEFPYVMGCYRGVVAEQADAADGPPGGGPPGGGPPQ